MRSNEPFRLDQMSDEELARHVLEEDKTADDLTNEITETIDNHDPDQTRIIAKRMVGLSEDRLFIWIDAIAYAAYSEAVDEIEDVAVDFCFDELVLKAVDTMSEKIAKSILKDESTMKFLKTAIVESLKKRRRKKANEHAID